MIGGEQVTFSRRPPTILPQYLPASLAGKEEDQSEKQGWKQLHFSLDKEARVGKEEHLVFDWREGGRGFQLCHRHCLPSPDSHRLDVP